METLEKIKENFENKKACLSHSIIICAGTGCIANGAMEVHAALAQIIKEKNLPLTLTLKEELPETDKDPVLLSKSGCQGFCQVGPLVTIEPDKILYIKVKPEDARDIIEKTILQGEVIDRLLYEEPSTGKSCRNHQEIPFYTRQSRTVLKSCGNIDPEDIGDYIHTDGYKAARDMIMNKSSQEVCDIMQEAGLRGRGGGGFTTGRKWELALKQDSDAKYIICNGDEGDPGAFMDRSVMEGNPHSVLEGMIIAAKACGGTEGQVYVRMEYPLAVERINKAIEEARAMGYLGKGIFGSDFDFDIFVMEGAGAFVCGEASAMTESIMGRRGMPRVKPPRTAEKGLWGKPTVVNNVETLACVPLIINMGEKVYKTTGTSGSPGTKTFALTGHVVNTGLIEVPFGTTLREIIFNIGGGVLNAKGEIDNDDFKAVQIGGPSGGCLIEEHLDIPLDFDSLKSVGAMVGSGGLVVMNKSTCMVQIARFFMKFTQSESCGKCVPCREGTRQILELIDEVTQGHGSQESLTLLEELCETVGETSLCGLGKSAPSPVLSTLKQFRSEWDAHVNDKHCPTGNCKDLVSYSIIADACKGCTACVRVCPVDAISGNRKEAHIIDENKCIRCGACVETCRFEAITVGGNNE
ncbi:MULTISPECIES: NADH-ubiquinone oxidoreductase-F iron-sulfur binding region domain-containing protein [unclassified Oceanispirochaeta]|uniref:NADH-ubiquinone oxidoreductase-F iron-sulfur binding region domain-containing protein n=1 Tax=unclassified Oceanispirochaeta TaxID=2635722 RepID=UPI000E08D875|nr:MULTISPECIES: NADH-ubiquinone oxidoreductase-F iron-sulfur binding region domain-containing protein [unclassified Oceanispirochaeta]MBF9017734.1 4Fe-4S binding protein [Oceanispirochaeta sp. M2]NPD72137.1 4Fe-4S binding protein [Oceanispirochaeta sp. M1]RDG32579.1 4Fe-4S dicluster domain-containing protein [Oceanispirochaeta sp. M1]